MGKKKKVMSLPDEALYILLVVSGDEGMPVVVSGVYDAPAYSQWPAVFSLRFVRRRSEVQRI